LLLLLGVYAAAIAAVVVLFLAYRVYVHHATFASRSFFWTGNLHQSASMGFELRPERRGMAVLNYGLHDPARQIAVRTDARGCRIPLAGAAAAPGGLAAIGCSCTFAHGVAAESSYVQLAADRLGMPAANLGVCGYSGVTSALLLREQIGAIQPRYVVYGFGNFHVDRDLRPRADSDLFQAHLAGKGADCRIEPPLFDNRLVFETAPRIESLYYEPRLAGRSTPLDFARLRAVLPLAFQDLSRGIQPKSLRLRFATPALSDTTVCEFLSRDVYDLCRQHDATFVLLFFPASFGDSPRPGLRAAVEALRGQPGFVFVDVSPRLFAGVRDQADYAQRWQVPRDGHPNRFMHLEMAQAIVEALEAPDAAPAAGPTAAP
jgi:hypothetical protein